MGREVECRAEVVPAAIVREPLFLLYIAFLVSVQTETRAPFLSFPFLQAVHMPAFFLAHLE